MRERGTRAEIRLLVPGLGEHIDTGREKWQDVYRQAKGMKDLDRITDEEGWMLTSGHRLCYDRDHSEFYTRSYFKAGRREFGLLVPELPSTNLEMLERENGIIMMARSYGQMEHDGWYRDGVRFYFCPNENIFYTREKIND